MERVLDKKMSKPPESDVEKTYKVAKMMGAHTRRSQTLWQQAC
ncbi:hypothetical protein NE451_06125 [Bacteroides nordii]|nr:hypothetical protein [Bacteroides nordii]MCQ4914065.1 hypothetical protein [Bacteroides nordii]